MRILATGGVGYIGNYVCKALAQHQPIVDAVVHLAACADLRNSSPATIYRNSPIASFSLFEFMEEPERNGPKKSSKLALKANFASGSSAWEWHIQ